MINKVKASLSEKILFIFLILLFLIAFGSYFLLKDKCLFVKKINLNEVNFTNKENTLAKIYIVRDPRDILLSWSKHRNKSLDNTLDFMLNVNSTIAYNDIHFLKDQATLLLL